MGRLGGALIHDQVALLLPDIVPVLGDLMNETKLKVKEAAVSAMGDVFATMTNKDLASFVSVLSNDKIKADRDKDKGKKKGAPKKKTIVASKQSANDYGDDYDDDYGDF